MSAAFFTQLLARFETLERELNTLDAAIGDGDHGSTMLKGLRDAVAAEDGAAKAFRKAAGGASGSLFGVLIGAVVSVLDEGVPLGDALDGAAQRISQIGQAKAGDKTMLDALIPAATAAKQTTSEAFAVAAAAAWQGVETTRNMAAKRGRAKYVENAGAGHVDAGATSVAEILTVLEDHAKKGQP